jgi:hypothetical protein
LLGQLTEHFHYVAGPADDFHLESRSLHRARAFFEHFQRGALHIIFGRGQILGGPFHPCGPYRGSSLNRLSAEHVGQENPGPKPLADLNSL